MKAVVLKDFGNVDNLTIKEIPIPTILANEVLVQVKAISINPVDIKTRTGKALAEKLKGENPLILGWDISGIVTEVGSAVTSFKKGDEVFGMVNFPGHGKAYAEYVAAPATHLALKPKNISHQAAAAATLAALTAWQAIVTSAKIKAGQKVLIHAAAGGVGHYAVQIAKHLGAYVIGTSSSRNKNFVLDLGADEHFDYQKQRFEDISNSIDFVLDTIGGENTNHSVDTAKKGAIVISLPSGLSEDVAEKAKAKDVNAYFLMVQSNGEDMKSIAHLLQAGKIKSHIMNIYTLDQIAEAHLQIETGRTQGKIVITL